jgi:DNA-binding CsgD family transcriptional regulator
MKFDMDLCRYKEKLINWNKLDEIMILKNQFFWINDFAIGQNAYVHPNVEKITGYPKEDFRKFSFAFSLMHPEDHDLAYEFSKRTISLTKDYRKELLEDPYFALFSIDFRLRCRDGHYIRVNRQTSCFRTDSLGNMVYALVLFNDISHLKKSNKISFTWFGNIDHEKYFGDLIRKYQNPISITVREKDVLLELAAGSSAADISRKLNISAHTVISHRKNLLRKTGAKNTAELIKFAFENSLI